MSSVAKLFPAASNKAVDWRTLVTQALPVQQLARGKWERGLLQGPTAVKPTNREGHAAVSWHDNTLLMFGGWGGGIRNDVFLLQRSAQGSFVWTIPHFQGQHPPNRYGHSLTRCGLHQELAVVYGGMQSGGYCAELESLWVLRPCQQQQQQHQAALEHLPCNSHMPCCQCPPLGSSSRQRWQQQQQHQEEYSLATEYEWYEPQLSGDRPGPRGYHAACSSQDGRYVYLFGGIVDQDCCSSLAVVDVTTWQCVVPVTTGCAPSPRFGCSLAEYDGKLWVVGGGYGNDLARSGHDLSDVYCLDLLTLEWRRAQVQEGLPDPGLIGRCHAYTLVGSKLLLFGGSLDLGNTLTWLDLSTGVWGRPCSLGHPPHKRMCTVMGLCGGELLIYGGWIYSMGEVGDIHSWRPLIDRSLPQHQQLLQQAAPGSSRQGLAGTAAGAGCSGGTPGLGSITSASGRGCEQAQQQEDEEEVMEEDLNRQIAAYYKLMRQANTQQGEGSGCPVDLVKEMQAAMRNIRAARERLMHRRQSRQSQQKHRQQEASSPHGEPTRELEGRAASAVGNAEAEEGSKHAQQGMEPQPESKAEPMRNGCEEVDRGHEDQVDSADSYGSSEDVAVRSQGSSCCDSGRMAAPLPCQPDTQDA
eukprot:CAMPEP_0202925138 /NCGR_PEP_ID=MMETSP1392-20130828/79339_1 /ASSEMBLY_ACC=CAM_ASM_000868 /TAXON_ID=225041 /ORGANISM="Chlamydomonas chlamydogama, Strain SAG 11-48b" /LENGTH=637 /DNA_ID=CAMNT_0049618899 /DNA_START=244 /DNA_END=2158 /DNA_ORIENTATION=+